MIPLRDANPSSKFPAVTITLIAINSLFWFYEVSLGQHVNRFVIDFGLIPVRFLNPQHFGGGLWGDSIVPLFTSIFLHGGWLHVIGNMWFLWIFGDNVEDRLGSGRFLLFYLLCGIGASLVHVVFHPESRIPTIGASGAISGVLGAYLISFPHARVLTLLIIFFIIRFVEIPAFAFLIIWFVFQFLSGTSQVSAYQESGGVAYWAHMGGFVFGVLLIWLFPKRREFRDRSDELDY